MKEPGITVALCCYNSAARLPQALKYIGAQVTGDDLKWEVLVVDNLSSDNTGDVAQRTWNALPTPVALRVVGENNPGLSNARKRAVYEARYEFILFCDDDNWLNETYVQRAYERMIADDTVGVLGGKGIPEFESAPPSWFGHFSSSYAVGAQAKASGYMGENRNVYGAGMVVRGEVLRRLYDIGFKSLLTGRKGEALSTGEDIEICLWYKMMGYTLYYDDELIFRHYIPDKRLTKDFFLKRTVGKGKTEVVFLIYKTLMNGKQHVPWLENKGLWYYEIKKRVLYFLVARMAGVWDFKNRVKAEFLWSAVRYRLNNYQVMKACAGQVRLYTAMVKEMQGPAANPSPP
jgi:glycosyltransferase involved in cell wall biosynthesis